MIGIAATLIPVGLFGMVFLFIDLETIILYTLGVGFVGFAVGTSLGILFIIRDKLLSDRSRKPLLLGIGAGTGAWWIGYGVTYLLVKSRVRDVIFRQLREDIGYSPVQPADYEMVGWIFYNIHFFDIHISDCCVATNRTFIGADGFTPVLLFIPPVLLFVAGFSVARFSLVHYQKESKLLSGFSEGGAIIPGYFLMILIGHFLFSLGDWFSGATASPSGSLILAGIIYPLVFGSIGGFTAVFQTR